MEEMCWLKADEDIEWEMRHKHLHGEGVLDVTLLEELLQARVQLADKKKKN